VVTRAKILDHWALPRLPEPIYIDCMDRTARLIIIVLLVILLIGVLPTWPYSHAWGYYPVGGVGLLLAIVIAVLLLKA